jgi:hypothetical protein
MLNSDQWTETIDAYLNGSMSAEDIRTFENALTLQPELKTALASQKLIRKGLEKRGKAEMKQLFKQFHQEMLEETNFVAETSSPNTANTPAQAKVVALQTRNRYTTFAIAASVVLLVGIGLAIFFNQHKEATNIASNQKITKIEYIENTEAQGFAPVTSTGKDYKTLILMKTDTYDKTHYEFIHRDTVTLFSNTLNPEKDNLQLIFDSQTNSYKLNINGKMHEIEQGFKGVKELK